MGRDRNTLIFLIYTSWLSFQLTLFLNPNTDPTNVRGTETRNQSERRATRVENGTAAELSFPHRIRFMMKNTKNTILKIKPL